MALAKPKRIYVLDVETGPTSFKSPENSQLLFVGVLPYIIRNGRYYAGRYRYFLPTDSKKLEAMLKRFPGLILGYNILGFDYRVLRPMISLVDIVDKTVDLFLLLHEKNDCDHAGLSLRALARKNLPRLRKMYLSKPVARIWRSAHREKALRYNRMDCRLTMALWWEMVHRREVQFEKRDKFDSFPYPIIDTIHVSERDVKYLLGGTRRFSYHWWLKQADSPGRFLPSNDSPFPVYWWRYCRHCARTYVFESQVRVVGGNKKRLGCPCCGASFDPFKLDPIISEGEPSPLGSVDTNLGDGHGRSVFPAELKPLLESHRRQIRGLAFIPAWRPPSKTYVHGLKNEDGTRCVLDWFYCVLCRKTVLFEEIPAPSLTHTCQTFCCPTCGQNFKKIRRQHDCVLIGQIDGKIHTLKQDYDIGTYPVEFIDLVSKYVRSSREIL